MADAMAPAGDNSAIEGALTQIESAIADIRAQLNQGTQAPAAPAAGAPGSMQTPSMKPGNSDLQSFMGGK
jgi:hypothetical protein